jgi:hypothetical protein
MYINYLRIISEHFNLLVMMMIWIGGCGGGEVYQKMTFDVQEGCPEQAQN